MIRILLAILVGWFVYRVIGRVFKISRAVNQMKANQKQPKQPKDTVYKMQDGSELIVKSKEKSKKKFDTEQADFVEIKD